ncbi:MAG TPA: hypothetical protein DEG17_23810 [Cyanobacteria bacterium UBA11149]|nr:hypothetical protein [Cyanobacteria bacterium UBA11367]HBE60828.1 hypothetical protein [Cyanobacteria bacterium UBA11366]HBK66802.1 hypothetical protein [Cyanobacteria bacterium UBA11166]HBR74204.1 hypothetical protein [Cyanobacteria bacterium UBA11159]HBS70444.1 hypothetical protein [Cyanobacteria bacterium UBA11153]HBW91808.1 hypothetical protein [Cyanobacteria bacterium UBA11149]HCA94165.1 hypothetical protein [Cyanobacteria bacterium UBA9226]
MSAIVSNPTTQELERDRVKLWMVLVGVNHYQDSQIPDLRYCANDCKELAAVLKVASQEFQETEIIPLYDGGEKSPELSEIMTSIQQFGLAKPEDTVLFYFSGHGYLDSNNRPIFCVADTSLADLAGTGFKLDVLLNELGKCQAQRQLVWLDACQEQEEDNSIRRNPTSQLLAALELQAEQSHDFYAMLSCNKTERSWEIPELKHGLFTYCLIEGLRGKAANSEGKIDADSLFKYVERNSQKFIEYKKNPLNLDGLAKGMRIPTSDSTKLTNKLKVKRLPLDASQTPQRIARGRGELIIGSANYSPQRKALIVDDLSGSLADIRLCQILQARGSFSVDYCFVREKQQRNLQEIIANYLQDETNQTVLLYLAGTIESTNSETYELVCNRDNRINLNLLGEELQNSPVKEIIVIADILDRSGTNKSLIEIWQPSQDKSLCLMAGKTSVPNSRKFLHQLITVLENAGESAREFWVGELITQLQINSSGGQDSQAEIDWELWLSGATEVIDILSVAVQRSDNEIFEIELCPYKSLAAFTQDDAYFFHGREELVTEIIEKLPSTSFLAVVGASGSGKSSVVRAGVIPKLLREGLFDGELEQYKSCQSWVMLPGDNPLTTLAKTLAPDNPDFLEGVLHLGVDSFCEWLCQQAQSLSVLVIDQFEELFTLTAPTDSVSFISLILGAINKAQNNFKVIITLRIDFLDECLGMSELAPLITKSQVLVPSCRLEDEQYRQIITQPAQKVGLEVEDGLIALLLEELKEGSLPLLQYALEELWQKRSRGKLTVKDYQRYIGKLGKFLSNKAQETYNNLSEAQQECAQSIFLSLVFLAEAEDSNKDTRRRLPISKLSVNKYKDVLDSTLQALIKARLIVVGGEANNSSLVNRSQLNASDETENQPINDLAVAASVDGETITSQSKDKVTVEIAHEILLRDWETLKWWLDENREKYRLIKEISQKADDWEQNGKREGFLLSKGALVKYEEFYVNYADELSGKSNEFIDVSIQARDKAEKLAKRRQRQIIGGLTGGIVAISMVAGVALWQLRRATISEINALSNSAEALLASNQELDALIAGLKVGRKIKNSFGVDTKTRIQLAGLLQSIIYQVKEFNRLEDKTDNSVLGPDNLVFSPDGKTIASTNSDGKIKLWNLKGKLLHTLPGHPNNVSNLVFSPDGKTIASAGDNGKTIKLWNLNGKLIHTFELNQDGFEYDMFFSTDGKAIGFASNDGTIKIWNLDGEIIGSFKSDEKVYSVAISPDIKTIASAGSDNKIKLWNLNGDLLNTFQGHTGLVYRIIFDANKNTLVSASMDGTIKLWNLQGGLLQTLKVSKNELEDDMRKIILSPDGSLIAAFWSGGESRDFQLWNLQGELIQTFFNPTGAIYKVAFSPDANTIAFDSNNTINLWNRTEDAVASLESFEGHTDRINHIEFSPDGKIIASASGDGTVKLWNLNGYLLPALKNRTEKGSPMILNYDGRTIASVNHTNDNVVELWNLEGELISSIEDTERVQEIAFSPDGSIIASGSNDNKVKLWNLEGKLFSTLEHTEGIPHDIEFSPDGKIIASASQSNNVVKIWNLEGKLLAILKHTDNIDIVKFSPNGKYIASVSGDKNVKIWNLKGELLSTIQHTYTVHNIIFTRDSKNLVSHSVGYSESDKNYEYEVKSWDLEGKLIHTLKDTPKDPKNVIYYAAIRPDGEIIAAVSKDKKLKLWTIEGKLIATLQGHTGDVESVVFSPDGKIIAAAGFDKTVKLWNLEGKLLSTLQESTGNIDDIRFSPDGRMITSISRDKKQLKLWNIKGELLSTLQHTSEIKNIVFSTDGKTIITSDQTIKLWSLNFDDVMSRGCNWARDYLTNNPNVSAEDRKICDGIGSK